LLPLTRGSDCNHYGVRKVVLALTLDGDRMWRRVPRVPGVPDGINSLGWDIWKFI
jgi:hypothetical protein